jgi:hypothetical protein
MLCNKRITTITLLAMWLTIGCQGFMNNNDINVITRQRIESHNMVVPSFSSPSSSYSSSRRLNDSNTDDDYDGSEDVDDGSDDDDDDEASSNDDDESNDNQSVISLDNLESCVPISQCELCHGGKRSGHSACSDTGKRIRIKCNSISDVDEVTMLYVSCNRTSIDEEYLVVR